jgi:hypothetical protein
MNPSSISGIHSSMRGTESKGNMSVHIELATVYQDDTGTVTELNGVPTKYPPGTHGDADHQSMRKPISDLEDGSLDDLNLQGVRASPGNVPIHERSRVRVREDTARRQKELSALNRERQEFQRQI